uniref:Integrase catalytic domain-containing protein n=1 Tax=Tanacetum cinerariifolium TaxID=118510 RepID=A0A6L2MX74_TANCI|nr:hypothetical protein [Tanacetum cinerariifolium]
MTGVKFDIKKFVETGDFGLWRIKMRALLIQHGCEAALEVLPKDMESQAKTKLNKKAHSAVILCLGNKVLREVTGETTAAEVWSKLETLYMIKSLANKLYLKKKLYTLCMPDGRKIFGFDFGGRDGHTKFKENQERSKAKGDDGEGLYVRGKTDRMDSRQSMGKSRSKSRGGRIKCYICQSDDHLKRNCPKNNRKNSTGYVKKDEQPSSSGSTNDDSELDILFDFMECDEGSVQLDDNRKCKIRGIDKVWHKRLGPISEAGLQVLEKQGLFGKKSPGKLYSCENCVLGKSHQVNFGVGRHTAQGAIDYAHSDLWGPSQVESLGGKRYFLSIVDDYSRRVWVYILRFKYEAFRKFKEWKQLVDNQIGRTVKKLRTNNGLKFCNWKFEQLCIESEIARHLTIVGTPQQNGIAEHMNRTLMNKVRCLLIQSGLPKTFWAEATCTAAYLINRPPSRAIEKKTPMEMWSGHLSDYRMLRIFGCVAYPHDKQGKLEPRAVKCVLLGYLDGVKGYRLYRLDDESSKIVTSKNVVFYESVMYKDTLKDSGAGDQETDQPSNLTNYQLVRDREPKTRTKPLRFRDESNMAAYAFVAAEEEDTHEPLTYQEAIACEENSKWKVAMKEEMDSLRKNKTWELVDHPARQKLVSCKWLFKIKERIEGVQKPRYKAKLVSRGFTQREVIDYNELDVKMAFLHGNLEEVIYMRQPPGYEQGNKAEIGSTKSLLKKEFDMNELGKAKKILDNGKSVKMPLGGNFMLSLKDCPIRDCDVERMSKVSYANAFGSLMYLMVCTRPDIAYAGTTNMGLVYGTNRGNHVEGFVDLNYTKDPDKDRSITGYAFLVQGYVVSWKATLQYVVALSTKEAKYMAFTEAVKEAIWLRGLLEELDVELNTVAVNCDHQGAIHLSRNHVFHERTKHINVRYHFIREVLEAKTDKVLKVACKKLSSLAEMDCISTTPPDAQESNLV